MLVLEISNKTRMVICNYSHKASTSCPRPPRTILIQCHLSTRQILMRIDGEVNKPELHPNTISCIASALK